MTIDEQFVFGMMRLFSWGVLLLCITAVGLGAMASRTNQLVRLEESRTIQILWLISVLIVALPLALSEAAWASITSWLAATLAIAMTTKVVRIRDTRGQ